MSYIIYRWCKVCKRMSVHYIQIWYHFLKNSLLFYAYLCVCVGYLHVSIGAYGSQSVIFPWSQSCGSCEPLDMGARPELGSSGRVVLAHNCWAISPAPLPIFNCVCVLLCAPACHVWRHLKRTEGLYFLELDSQVVVSHLVWGAGTWTHVFCKSNTCLTLLALSRCPVSRLSSVSSLRDCLLFSIFSSSSSFCSSENTIWFSTVNVCSSLHLLPQFLNIEVA